MVCVCAFTCCVWWGSVVSAVTKKSNPSKHLLLLCFYPMNEFEHKKEYSSACIERQEIMAQQATWLKKWAELFNIPVLVTNQITTRFNDNESGMLMLMLCVHIAMLTCLFVQR
eukprot:m.64101 g.64101  ORF g.64101 m.64101 type:complete len:113 (+) comp11475_c0_seq4:87-425(+)